MKPPRDDFVTALSVHKLTILIFLLITALAIAAVLPGEREMLPRYAGSCAFAGHLAPRSHPIRPDGVAALLRGGEAVCVRVSSVREWRPTGVMTAASGIRVEQLRV